MATREAKATFTLSAVDKATRKVRNVAKSIGDMTAPVRKVRNSLRALNTQLGFPRVGRQIRLVGREFSKLGSQVTRAMGGIALAGGGIAFAFKRSFIDTAAEFERFETVLKTVEGSSEGAKRSMDWVSNFAAKTPFELAEVVDGFVKLKVFGLDPMNGMMKTLGDTAAAMGKNLEQPVEALKDAVSGGGFERLKDLGITANTVGKKTILTFQEDGKEIRKIVDKNNKALLQTTILDIWQKKFGGAADELSKTWGGMMSNLSDQWTRFANMVMNNGVFDVLKGRLAGLLQRINAMAASGELKRLAEMVGSRLVAGFSAFFKVLKNDVAPMLRAVRDGAVFLRDTFGSWKPVIAGVAAIVMGPLLLSLAAATKSVIALGVALMATPVGWIMAAIAAVSGAAYLIYKNWEPIKTFFSDVWEAVKITFQDGIDWIKNILSISPLGLLIKGANAVGGLVSRFVGGSVNNNPVARTAAPVTPGVQRTENTSNTNIRLEVDDNRIRTRKIETNGPTNIEVDNGRMLGMAM